MKTASNRPLMDGVDSVAVPEEMRRRLRGALACAVEDSGAESATRGDSTFVSCGPAVESDLCGTGVNVASASR